MRNLLRCLLVPVLLALPSTVVLSQARDTLDIYVTNAQGDLLHHEQMLRRKGQPRVIAFELDLSCD